MNKLYCLVQSLLPENTLSVAERESLIMRCTHFIKVEITLIPIYFRLPIQVLIQLFFLYCFINSGCKGFNKLPNEQLKSLIKHWENLWHPGYQLLRLLRSLIYLCYFDTISLR